MLTLYLILMLIGGSLIALSLFFGGDADADADLDTDLDADVDADADIEHGGGLVGATDLWLPFASLRFWIFFSGFFGLAGTLLTTLGHLGSEVAVAGIAAGAGYLSGVGAVAAMKWLRRSESDSSVRAADLVGCRGRVTVAVRSGDLGKVRLSLKGQVSDYLATTEDDSVVYEIGDEIMVYDTTDDGHVVITRADQTM